MTRSARWLFLAAMLPMAACASKTPAPVTAVVAPPALAAADQAFVNAAASSDAAEVQLGQLAATKARNPRIKHFATTMVTAHTQTTQQLQTIAQSKGVTPDATLSPAAQDMLTKLTAAHAGAVFDRDYIRNQVAAHMAAVQVFQAEIASGTDADLKAFATSTLPTIQAHLKMARQLSGMRH